MSSHHNLHIYGISHIIYSADNLKSAEKIFLNLGYILKNEEYDSMNASAKEEFISGEMATSSDMLLMEHPQLPDVEIKRENIKSKIDTSSAYSFYFKDEKNAIGYLPKLFDRSLVSNSSLENNLNIFIKCNDIQKALSFWKELKMNINFVDHSIANIKIKNVLSRKKTNLILYSAKSQDSLTWLDQKGLVCLSFLCADVAVLHDRFKKLNYYVGEIFQIYPFGRGILVFFVRNFSGEVYEFISPVKSE